MPDLRSSWRVVLAICAVIALGAIAYAAARSSHATAASHALPDPGAERRPSGGQDGQASTDLRSAVEAYLAMPEDPSRKRAMLDAVHAVHGPADDTTVASLIRVITVNRYVEDEKGPRQPRAGGQGNLPPTEEELPVVGALERIGLPAGALLAQDALRQGQPAAAGQLNISLLVEEEVLARIYRPHEAELAIDRALAAAADPGLAPRAAAIKAALATFHPSPKE